MSSDGSVSFMTTHYQTFQHLTITVYHSQDLLQEPRISLAQFGLVVAEASSGSPECHAVSWLQSLMRQGPGHNVPPSVQKLLDV